MPESLNYPSDESKAKVKAFLDEDVRNRGIPWEDLWRTIIPTHRYDPKAIERTMQDLGYKRHVWRRNIKLTRAERDKRIEFARSCLERWPTEEDWVRDNDRYVLFNGMAFINDATKWRSWTTVDQCETPAEWDSVQKHGDGRLLIWGCFSTHGLGPCYVWAKGSEAMTGTQYVDNIVPLLDRVTMADIASEVQLDYTTAETADWSKYRRLECRMLSELQFPPNSPDLNVMQEIWSWMRKYIHENYDAKKMSLEDYTVASNGV
ncbi:hypothetical protein F4804DRAFT_332299 [Jackrogersella minutella]|nr:hypothetical protein F4804DRAFT_332299 [Jackrogersella minutella]